MAVATAWEDAEEDGALLALGDVRAGAADGGAGAATAWDAAEVGALVALGEEPLRGAGRTAGGARTPGGARFVRARPPARRSAAEAEALLLEVVQRHADELMRIARMHSLDPDDAHDAYQRGLEQFLRHGRRLERETAHRWLFTVLKHEARAVRRARSELVAVDEEALESMEARGEASPEERVLARDVLTRSAEALGALKASEVRALWLQADGCSYAEIAAATGWTPTKVNRLLAEGRKRFLRRCAELEAGTHCADRRAALVAVAGGTATAAELVALRPHLRRCPACRATIRGLHASRTAVAAVLPPGVLGLRDDPGSRLAGAGRWLARALDPLTGPLHDRAFAGAMKLQAATDAATAGKLAAVAASTVALAGGGAAVVAHHAGQTPPQPSAHRAAAATRAAARAISLPASVRARTLATTTPVRPAPRTAAPTTPRATAPPRSARALAPTRIGAEFGDVRGSGPAAEFGGPADDVSPAAARSARSKAARHASTDARRDGAAADPESAAARPAGRPPAARHATRRTSRTARASAPPPTRAQAAPAEFAPTERTRKAAVSGGSSPRAAPSEFGP